MKIKSRIVIVFASFFGLLGSSCHIDAIDVSDTITIQEVSYSGYTALKVSDDFNIYVTFSDTEEEIRIEANQNLHERIYIKKVDNQLVIKLRDYIHIRGKKTLNVYITTTQILDYDVSGDAMINLENTLEAQNVSVYASGDSSFSGELLVDYLRLESKGDSDIDISGNTRVMNARLTGDSALSNYNMYVDDLIIIMTGDSDAYLFVGKTISVDANGDSILRYKGNPVITHQRLFGDSKIIKKN